MLYVPGWDCHGLPIELKGIIMLISSSNCVELSNRISLRIEFVPGFVITASVRG